MSLSHRVKANEDSQAYNSQASSRDAQDSHAMQQYLAEYDHQRALFAGQQQDSSLRLETSKCNIGQWEKEWKRMAQTGTTNDTSSTNQSRN